MMALILEDKKMGLNDRCNHGPEDGPRESDLDDETGVGSPDGGITAGLDSEDGRSYIPGEREEELVKSEITGALRDREKEE